MGKTSTTWKPGQSGNPAGRPPKSRALTDLLEIAGNKAIEDVDGKKRAGKRVLARLIWEIAVTGQCTMPDGKVLAVESVAEWKEVMKFLYSHIDGPPPKAIDLTSGGEPVKAYVNVSPDDWDDDGDDDDETDS